ncbi:MAG: toll/interleukin-1 receptor domain-containing protein [Chitinophagaceae bacterium]|nr:toll/interleukin-1 receptor domain-containing protein [Chitinophagaceae bacterium]
MTEDQEKSIDIFISFKSADIELAESIYNYLRSNGLSVFLSSETLPQLGSSDYRKAIDKALDECKHMIVVSSKVEYLNSSWVEAEWGFYVGEKRAGRKKGNILTVVTDDIEIKDLPASLRYYQVIFYSKDNLDQIAAYVGKDYEDPQYKPKPKNFFKSKKILPGILILAAGMGIWYYINEKNKPFDVTVFAEKEKVLQLNADYPAFESGLLSLYIGNKEDSRTILPNQPVTFQQVPASFVHQKIAAKITSPYWKLAADSIVISKLPVHLPLIPNGALANIYGNIKDIRGEAVADCSIIIDTDTTVNSSATGFFKITLPYHMQKSQYKLTVNKKNYQSQRLDYFPGSGNIDVIMKKPK